MPKIVDSDTLNPGLGRSPIHFPVKVVLRNGEYPFIRFNAIQAFEIILLRKIFYPAESPAAYRCSFLNLRLTYEASHPIACDGCYHARTVAGGEYLLSTVVAASGNCPDYSELIVNPPIWLIAHHDHTERSLFGGALFDCQGASVLFRIKRLLNQHGRFRLAFLLL